MGISWNYMLLSQAEYFSQQDFVPKIHLSEEDFAVITNNGAMLDDRQQVNAANTGHYSFTWIYSLHFASQIAAS